MMWYKHETNGKLAQGIRRDLRMYRREKGKGGHRFSYKDLNAIYADTHLGDTEEGLITPHHAVVTHHADLVWQHYWRHPERGWLQQNSYASKETCLHEVENVWRPPKDNFRTPPRDPKTGDYIPEETQDYMIVSWGKDQPEAWRSKAPTSPWVQKQMLEVLTRLGCTTRIESTKVEASAH